MNPVKILYAPIGVGTFHMPSAQDLFERSVKMLEGLADVLNAEALVPEKPLLSVDELTNYLKDKEPDLILLQNITFANAAYTQAVMHLFKDKALLLWTLPEPVAGDGGRLRLNSLTGAFSAANTMHMLGKTDYGYMIGTPEDEKVADKIRRMVKAVYVVKKLKETKMASIGHTPQGFGFGRALDIEMERQFGVTLESVEVREIINKAKSYDDSEIEEVLQEAGKTLVGLEKMPEKNVKDFARLLKAYRSYVKEGGIAALSSRCWPDLFTEFGTPVCAVLSLLNAEGIASACESDAYGALSMYIGTLFTGGGAFFGDPVYVNEEENTLTFWHCGMAPCNMARKDTGACVGVHPNRKIGPTMEFGTESAERATILRVGKDADGSFRLFAASGSVLDKPRQFLGTSMVVRTDVNAKELVENAVKEGWEPHFAIVTEDIREELTILSDLLKIRIVCR